MALQGPNPIEMYEAAIQQMLPTLAGVQAGQLNSSTPCSEWNVQGLLNHQLKVAQFCYDVVAQTGAADPSGMGAVNDPLPSEGVQAAFEAGTSKVLQAIKAPGKLETVVETPFGAMPAGNFIMIPMIDIIIHKWDLAKATNQNTTLDSGLAEAGYQVLMPGVEMGRQGGFFGPEITIPIAASAQEKLLGLSGRQP